MPSLRKELGKILVELGKEHKNLVVITGDLGKSTGVSAFETFAERYFNLGISEQDLMGTAAGLASAGKTPVVSTYAIFLAGRAWEQIRNSVARDGLNVKMIATHSGISPSADGSSHQCFEDIALIRTIPGTTLVLPADLSEMRSVVRAAVETTGPFYIRLGRGEIPEIFDDRDGFQVGKARRVSDGPDVGIIAAGFLVPEAIEAEALLKKEGISASVVDMHTVKPADVRMIDEIAGVTGAIVTVEDHNILGGLGSTVAEIVCRDKPVPIEMVGIHDRFGESGDLRELMEIHGLTAHHIADAAKKVMKLKENSAVKGGRVA
ncbi:transketolase family protein [Candidatus Bathyarchaeota archaeon]|jgi:transketolase|nr:transketolase family protein [Candidatus Bathyarchaeota archaeon]